jgi:hypothetical protein
MLSFPYGLGLANNASVEGKGLLCTFLNTVYIAYFIEPNVTMLNSSLFYN